MSTFQAGDELAVGGVLLTILSPGEAQERERSLSRRLANAVEDGHRGGELVSTDACLTAEECRRAARLWKARRSIEHIAELIKASPEQVAFSLNGLGLIAGSHHTRLTSSQSRRLKAIEHQNRRRAREKGVEVEKVDFIAICDAQNWKCAITGEPLDPSLKGPHPKSISLDHCVGLTLNGGHIASNIQATTLEANHRKGNTVESKLGAKAKRQAGETGQRARRNRAKEAGTYKAMPSQALKSGGSIAPRQFDRTHTRTIASKNRPSQVVRRPNV